MKRLVLGVLAHVDSGKTTLSEAMLYRAGEIRRLGRVDHGDAFLDTDAQERERGITIYAKSAALRLSGLEITLLDTPGHVDFSAEAERTLQVLDAAILVISGTDGVQSHTETLWRLLERYQVPTFLYINKMDLPGANAARVLAGLQQRLAAGCVAVNDPAAPCAAQSPAPLTLTDSVLEDLAVCDEGLMELVLGGGAAPAALDEAIAAAVKARRIFPCIFGSALQCTGVDDLFSALERWASAPAYGAEFAAQVYKITRDEQGARLTHLKVTGGSLKTRALISGSGPDGPWQQKVSGLRIYSGAKYRAVEEVPAGGVCAVLGLEHTRPGQGLGAAANAPAPVLEPVMSCRLILPEGADPHTALALLRKLEQEEPSLHVLWQEDAAEIHLQLMGQVQIEILSRLLAERGLPAQFGPGRILYRETVAAAVEGVGHYEPLRHYAEVHLLLEPGERGSGLQFASSCRTDDLDLNWQRLILTHLAEKPHRGVLTGAPITDIRITLLAGRAHPKHTEGGDFRQATYRAVRQGLRSTESVLLEPWYDFRLEVPGANVGRALTDLERRGAEYAAPEVAGDTVTITGHAPVAALQDYAAELAGYTHGMGRLGVAPAGYRPCHNAAQVIAAANYNADADAENPADSIFCSHGAGTLVKWNRVREHMHIDTGWGRRAAAPLATAAARAAEAAPRSSAARYGGTLQEDRELLAIFERTYGPIRRRQAGPEGVFGSTASQLRRESLSVTGQPLSPAGACAAAQAAGPEYLLVDGYNILFAWEDLKALAAEDLAAARGRLMDILCNYRGWHGGEVILVFDAYKVKGAAGEVEEYHGIHVVYTKEAETADMYIEKTTHKLARNHRVRVATSDALEQLIILGHGALRLSAAAFRQEVDAAEAAIREYLTDA